MAKAAGGVSRRSNSANPLGPQARLSPDGLAEVERFYRAAGQPAYVRLPSMLNPSVDRGLAEAGWVCEGETVTLVGPLAAPPAQADVECSPLPSAQWLAASNLINGRSAASGAAFAAVLARLEAPSAFAAVREGGVIGALGYGVVHDGWLCLEAVATAADLRGRGLAGQAVSALMAWAKAQGAYNVCLQTQVENLSAQALYRRLGVERELYRYHYRRKPAP